MIETPVVVSDALPYAPTPGEVGRRIVRHGLADVLEWLGEEPGPEPDALTHMLWFDGRYLVSQQTYDRMLEQIREREAARRWRVSLLPQVANPAAPTVAELNAGIEVGGFYNCTWRNT